jgi:hypothetical protein
VPREWPNERAFILCGGESIRAQREQIKQIRGHIIAIKEGVLLRPDAEVLFIGGEHSDIIAKPLIPMFRGKYIVARGKSNPGLPSNIKRVSRTKDHSRLCDDPTTVCGYDTGTSAINLAYHFGAREIVLLGYDMTGTRWFNGEWKHPMPMIPDLHFRRHMKPLGDIARDAKAKGIRIVNCSPISRVECFEKQPLEKFL